MKQAAYHFTDTHTEPLPKWQERAICGGKAALLGSDDPERITEARALCRRCPVLTECRTDVLAVSWRNDPDGVVAGMTKDQRTRFRMARSARRRRASKAAS